jgi:hypothetical protein
VRARIASDLRFRTVSLSESEAGSVWRVAGGRWPARRPPLAARRIKTSLPQICAELNLDLNELTFTDLSFTIARWLKKQA